MGIGLSLTGRRDTATLSRKAPPAVWLEQVEAWARSTCGDALCSSWQTQSGDREPALCLQLHPSAEPVEIIAAGRGRVWASALTSTTGPGYHVYVCDLLRRLGSELGVTWNPPSARAGTGDETGYFHTNDRARLECEMLQWLQSLARVVRENGGQADGPCACCLPLDHRYMGEGAALTPTGPRDAAWLRAVEEDPRRGTDFFPWWGDGMEAHYHLGRAMCQMWTQVRWRPPLTDEEADVLAEAAARLEAAYRLDATLEYPWREWRELLGYLEIENPLAAEVAGRAAQQAEGPRIGYRRQNVGVVLSGGWSIEVPGALAECWAENGTWEAWDATRSVYVTAFSRPANGKPPSARESLSMAPATAEGEQFQYEGETVLGRASLRQGTQENPHEWLLSAASAAAGSLALLTVCYQDPADRQWAIDTWHSLTHRAR